MLNIQVKVDRVMKTVFCSCTEPEGTLIKGLGALCIIG